MQNKVVVNISDGDSKESHKGRQMPIASVLMLFGTYMMVKEKNKIES